MKLRKGFWIYLPVAIFAWITPITSAKADALGEWTYSQSAACNGSIEVINDTIILHGPNDGGCGGQSHWVKIETTIPADMNLGFTWAYQTNDGWNYDPPQYGINGVYTLLTQQNNATGTMSVPVEAGDVFTFRQYSTDSCCQPGHLTISNLSLWNGISQSTTTTTTSTTTTSTTTTSTTTTTSSTTTTTTTTEPQTTTTTSSVPQTTSTESTTTTLEPPETTTSTTTSSLVPETTTTIEYVAPPVQQEPVVVQPEPIEEPTIPDMEPIPVDEPETTLEEPPFEEVLPDPITPNTTVSPDQTLPFVEPEITEPEIVIEDSIITEEDVNLTLEALDPATELTAEVLEEVFNLLDSDNVTEEQVQEIVDAVIDNLANAEEITDEVLTKVLNILEADSVTEEQVREIVGTILATDVSSDQATQLANSAAVLENVSSEQATEIFSSIDTGELTAEEAAAIVEAIIDAPTEVKEAFEEEINVFGGGFDEYVATGSVISVGARRVIVAVTTVSFITPPPVVSRRR